MPQVLDLQECVSGLQSANMELQQNALLLERTEDQEDLGDTSPGTQVRIPQLGSRGTITLMGPVKPGLYYSVKRCTQTRSPSLGEPLPVLSGSIPILFKVSVTPSRGDGDGGL